MQGNLHIGEKKNIFIFCVVLLLQCIIIVAWGTQKERMHVDEMFTMEGVKKDGESMQYWDLEEDFYGTEHSRKEFLARMTVREDDLIIKEGTMRVVGSLLYEDLYYTLINLLSSIKPGHIPWAVCAGFNLLCFLVAQIILYGIVKEDFGGMSALFTTVIYGFSAGGISTVLYARCYMMLIMFEMLLIYVLYRFVKSKKEWQRLLYIICSGALAFFSYRTHQFGMILFFLTTGLAVLYMLIKKKWDLLLWLGAGYGIPCLLGYRIIWNRIRAFFVSGVAPVFYHNLINTPISWRITYMKELFNTIAEHMFCNVWIMLLIFIVVGYYFIHIKIWRANSAFREKAVILGAVIIIMVYGLMLVLGGAVAWRYISPIYPFVALLLGITISMVCADIDILKSVKKVILAMVIGIPIISYGMHCVSEMYTGEKALREELEAHYHGVNGVMVHHDVQGDGENWLYEAATLWPEESNVLVLQHHMILEKGLFECRDDDKILLWLTVDFDREESIELFKACTDYTDIRPILNTEHVWVYECSK